MDNYFQEALSLLGVGMITVFIILLFVVLIGKGSIFFVNKFFPDSGIDKTAAAFKAGIGASKTAAIVAAVNVVTKGKGRVDKIEKKVSKQIKL
ncbi:OadG family protein [Marinilabiliaceae bacterium ANBcel2]|nr:OadG family protein [Marinilabiliaceae bacterium ANBcel2]